MKCVVKSLFCLVKQHLSRSHFYSISLFCNFCSHTVWMAAWWQKAHPWGSGQGHWYQQSPVSGHPGEPRCTAWSHKPQDSSRWVFFPVYSKVLQSICSSFVKSIVFFYFSVEYRSKHVISRFSSVYLILSIWSNMTASFPVPPAER